MLHLDPRAHPAVRDLVEVMGSPGLLAAGRPEIIPDAECARLLEAHREAIRDLERDPSPLLRWIEEWPGAPLLGRYFEAILGFWIVRLLGARRWVGGLKLARERQVTGELDFVFEPGSGGGTEHWECSVKFYLCTAEPSRATEARDFLGTMTRDRLDKKLRRLFERQLAAPSSPEGRTALEAAGFGGAAPRSRLFMKGALFYPHGAGWRNVKEPLEVSPAHLRGWWARELPEGGAWARLDRRRWLSRFVAPAGIFEPLDRAGMLHELARHFADARTAVMVAALERAPDGSWLERERGLVVHPGWPWAVRE